MTNDTSVFGVRFENVEILSVLNYIYNLYTVDLYTSIAVVKKL